MLRDFGEFLLSQLKPEIYKSVWKSDHCFSLTRILLGRVSCNLRHPHFSDQPTSENHPFQKSLYGAGSIVSLAFSGSYYLLELFSHIESSFDETLHFFPE